MTILGICLHVEALALRGAGCLSDKPSVCPLG